MIDFVTFGIIVDDLVFPDGRTQMGVLGGGGVQTAWGMATALGSGEKVGLVAGVGGDFDQSALLPLQNAGINLEGLRTTDFPTPRAWQIMETDGRRTQVWRTPPQQLGEQLAKKWELLPFSYQVAQHFHWGIHLNDPAPVLGQWLKERGKYVSLESFKAADHPLTKQELIKLGFSCQILSLAKDEFVSLLGNYRMASVFTWFHSAGGQYLVIRKGKDGAILFDLLANCIYKIAAIPTHVVDQVGAGNAFCGAFLARLGEGVSEALCHGVVAASYMVEQFGIPHTLPSKIDYLKRLELARSTLEVSQGIFSHEKN